VAAAAAAAAYVVAAVQLAALLLLLWWRKCASLLLVFLQQRLACLGVRTGLLLHLDHSSLHSCPSCTHPSPRILCTHPLAAISGKFSKSRGVGVFGNDAKDTGIPVEVGSNQKLY